MRASIITEPAVEPWVLNDVKAMLAIPDTESDTAITSYIVSARRQAEQYLQRKLITQTLEMPLDDFPSGSIELGYGPVQSITSVKYDDADGVEQTIDSANYTLDNYGMKVWLHPAYSYTWPSPRSTPNAVRVRYVAGWGDAGSDVPDDILQAMLLLIGHWLRFQKEAESGIGPTRVPRQFYDLLWPYAIQVP
jgi:uncharacterized phiE125 gp8 family phage protein